MSRGENNNNPGNVRLSSTKFQGEIEGTDESFKTFSSPHFGIRALARILLTYNNNYGLHTVHDIISRWAPGTENDTTSYIDDVCRITGFGPYSTLDLTDGPTLDKLVTAIIYHENGEIAYKSDDIIAAVDDALGN